MILDGKNIVMGRLSTEVAKKLLKNEEVTIINAEKVIITGNKTSIVEKYLKMRDVGSQKNGPFFPRAPDRILRRTIRGMMPYKTRKGKAAMKKLSVVIGTPEEYVDKDVKKVAEKPIKTSFVYLGEVSKTIGWVNG